MKKSVTDYLEMSDYNHRVRERWLKLLAEARLADMPEIVAVCVRTLAAFDKDAG